MSRTIIPSIFALSWAPGVSPKEGAGIHLRWMIQPQAGLPRAQFLVWINPHPQPKHEILEVSLTTLSNRSVILDWGNESMSVIMVHVQLSPGQQMSLRAYDGPVATSKMIDEDTRTSSGMLVVYGGRLSSAMLTGSGEVIEARAITTDAYVNDPGWILVERVGLPVDKGWGPTGYPPDPQGRLHELAEPRIAAERRLNYGGPTSGWQPTNDRGHAMPAWAAPNHPFFIDELSKTVLPGVHEMLVDVAESDRQVEYRKQFAIPAPTSIHGDQAAGEATASVAPLGAMLSAAASDPFAALGLGFGTFLSFDALRKYVAEHNPKGDNVWTHEVMAHAPNKMMAAIAQPAGAQLRGMIMVTVEHKLVFELPSLFPGKEGKEDKRLRYPVTLADVAFHPVLARPPDPTGLAAERIALDRPNQLDTAFLETAAVVWDRPVQNSIEDPHACSYATSFALGAHGHKLQLSKRMSGGHRPLVPAQQVGAEANPDIQWTVRGLPEPAPGVPPAPDEPAGVVFSVAGQDWFGRWSGWESIDYKRSVTRPQIPALMRVELVPLGGEAPSQAAAVDIEFTWNWSDRSPEVITFDVKLHRDGTAVPSGAGMIVSVGAAATTPYAEIDFNGAAALPSVFVPPGGNVNDYIRKLVDNPPIENLTRYHIRLLGFQLDFATHPRICASVRMRATEHARPGMVSDWGRTLSNTAASPVPPPRPVLPPGMVWSSLPDAKGFARANLSWPISPGVSYVLYAADETSVRRELANLPGGFPSADLRERPHARLLTLRNLPVVVPNQRPPDFRRAFKRIADEVTSSPYEVELPKGSKLIHFYVLLGRSASGVESPFPTQSNDWLAVATPRAKIPNAPRIHARPSSQGVRIEVMLDPGQVGPLRVDLHRTASASNSTTLDHMGPPLSSSNVPTASAGWTISGNASDGYQLIYVDTTVPEDWSPRWYRAVVWSATNTQTGDLAARSEPSPASIAARKSSGPPTLLAPSATRVGPSNRILVRWSCALPLERSPLGIASYDVSGRTGTIEARSRLGSDAIATYIGALPELGHATPVFRHHLNNPSLATYCAWLDLPPGAAQVTIQAVDPAGRTATVLIQVPGVP
jgi:hypothetical protein